MTRAKNARFSVGIDLGTTNCALAAVPLEGDAALPEPLPLPQVVRAGEVRAEPVLPSFLYLPSEVELPAGSLALPWEPKATTAVGVFAREQGAKVPARLISSAKSWLSHPDVDRRGALLPFGAPDELSKLSPVQASARYLGHLRAAWDAAHPEAPLHEQELTVTVPASFDAVARELTAEAVAEAGLAEHLTLLEEPQAALYAWVAAGGEGFRKQVSVGDRILVVDVGGGTTDLSLIEVREQDGNLELHRIAVGDHILLGGDNMDLALAHVVRPKLKVELDAWQERALAHACRAAKERLLGEGKLAAAPVVIPGRGSKLVGGTLKSELTRAEVTSTLVDGFFPLVEASARPAAVRRLGLTALGLPFASDPAITRHLAAFLGRQPGAEGLPTALLFNGGVTRAAPLTARIVELLDGWRAAAKLPAVKVLTGTDPELAVARGAAYHGRVRLGTGLRIRGGTARAYYVGIERSELAVPGIPQRVDALCVAPFGMEEGSEVTLPPELGLVVGEPASFRLFASSTRRDDKAGAAVEPGPGLEELSPIETTLAGPAGKVVPVRLHARYTEVGTLELFAVESSGGKRWKLSYDVRGK